MTDLDYASHKSIAPSTLANWREIFSAMAGACSTLASQHAHSSPEFCALFVWLQC
ncbi:hypothetical protein [Bradyrhizobium sp. RDI18]|uniref:hypothetical protein n=1 Tax=Bradyrhizobium sp. RDI18 TaxID=3367400 RepID=UPI0037231982